MMNADNFDLSLSFYFWVEFFFFWKYHTYNLDRGDKSIYGEREAL